MPIKAHTNISNPKGVVKGRPKIFLNFFETGIGSNRVAAGFSLREKELTFYDMRHSSETEFQSLQREHFHPDTSPRSLKAAATDNERRLTLPVLYIFPFGMEIVRNVCA